mgnify:CR=1 FL=1
MYVGDYEDLADSYEGLIDAIKHEIETPMRGHGECCDPAPADVDPDEALAKVLCSAFWGGQVMPSADNADWANVARAAREHIEAEWEEVAKSFEDGRDKWQAAHNEMRARAEKAEAERDALRERLDALRADIRQDRATFTPSTATAILARDDERGAP